MITKNDCMSILIKLEDRGVEKASINEHVRSLMRAKGNEVPLETLRFISNNRGIEVANFYEMLRNSHNKKKSPLYTNIVSEIVEPKEVLTTLSSMLTQIFLYSRKIDNVESFLKEIRAEEISRVLNNYCATGNFDACIKLLRLIKSDLVVLEYIAGRRDLD